MPADKLPTGFEPLENVLPEGDLTDLDCLPCKLYTDRTGVNYIVLEHDRRYFVLPVRTD